VTDLLLRAGACTPEALAQMGRKSKDIIAAWSLDRFVAGVMQAMQLPRAEQAGVLSDLAVRLWKDASASTDMKISSRTISTAPKPQRRKRRLRGRADMLRARGHQVVEFTRHSDDIRSRGAAGVLQGALATPWNPFSAAALRRLILRERPDLVHAHNTFPLISPSIFSTAHALGVPTVLTLHNYRTYCAAGIPMRRTCRARNAWIGRVCCGAALRLLPRQPSRHAADVGDDRAAPRPGYLAAPRRRVHRAGLSSSATSWSPQGCPRRACISSRISIPSRRRRCLGRRGRARWCISVGWGRRRA